MIEQDGIQRGSYSVCLKQLTRMGFSDLEAKMICAEKFFKDEIEDDEPDRDNRMNLMFTNAEDCVSHKISILHDEHPTWTQSHIVAAAHGICGVSKQKDDIEATPEAEHIGGRELGGRASPMRSTSGGPFTQLMKLIKGGKGLKVGGMGLIPFKIHLPMKNLNRLQTKLEKLITMEQQNLTAEELQKRAEYAKLMKKSDSDLHDIMISVNDSIKDYKQKTPNITDDQIEQLLFGKIIGIKEDLIYGYSITEFGDANTKLNNIIKAPIILAVEGVQKYELIQEDGSVKTEWHFKPYDELVMAIDGMDKLPMILEHPDKWTDIDTMGCVRQLTPDPKIRGIRGIGYFVESKTPESILSILREKKPFQVSIGFRARKAESGTWNGYHYDFTQREILLDHLGIILKSIPRCDIDKCGGNIEGQISTDSREITNINRPNYYYNINKLIYDSLENNESKTNITDLKKSDSMTNETQIDSIDHWQPKDFKIFLNKLQEYIDEGKVSATNVEANLITKLGDNMDQKEFETAIALKDATIEKLESEVPEKISKILTIKKFTDSYTDDELSKMTLDQLKLLEDATSRFNPSKKKAEMIPVAGKSEEVKDAGKKLDREDPRKMFDHIKKDFELYGYLKDGK